METNAFNRLRTDFLKSPVQKWGAILSSVCAAVAFVLLLVVLYLFVDLIVWKGIIPGFAEQSAARKQQFSEDWAKYDEGARLQAASRLPLGVAQAELVAKDDTLAEGWDPAVWESRWQVGTYLFLKNRVSDAAADQYLPEKPNTTAAGPPRLGVLSLVVRERHRWSNTFGRIMGWVASWNSWMWDPASGGGANRTYLLGLFVVAFIIALIHAVLLNAIAYFASIAMLDTLIRIRRALYFHTFRLGSLAVRTLGTAEAVSLFSQKVETVGDALYAWLTTTYRQPVKFFLLLIFILLLNFWLAVSFLMLAMLVWLIGGQVAAYFRREARSGTRQADAALTLLQESIGLLRLAKCYQMERFSQNRVERQLAESARANWRKLRGNALSRPMLGSAALLAGVALLYLAARAVLVGEFSAAGLVVMGVALISLVPPIASWFESRLQMQDGQEAAEAIYEFLDRKGDAAEAGDAEFLPALTNRMEFRHVSLKEAGTGRMLLENVSFAVPAGAKIAIVGSDPDEKHALMYLIPRFLDPTSGEIRIEDKNIKWVTHESLRAQVAVVMQNDLTFSDTVVNNIGCGDPGYNLPQIIEAAKLAHAHQFIERLPYGYETHIGAGGLSLKPGESFRIALARALLRDPALLIIEEPTGAMDDDTLALLDDTLERIGHGRTVIFLAYRLSTLRRVSRVFLLKDGHLEASGSHRDLWQNNELYRRLQILADATIETAAVQEED